VIPASIDAVSQAAMPRLLAVGFPPLRYDVDTWARRELVDHIAALCGHLHGRRPAGTDCLACASLERSAP
jgi:hypothetical protein